MAEPALRAFLNGKHLACLATLKPDGSPHITPMWYHHDGGRILMTAQHTAVKVRNIRREPRVAVCIASEDTPYKAAIFEGTAEVKEEGAKEVVRATSARYLGKRKGEKYAREVIQRGGSVLIAVTPKRVINWEY